MLFILATMFREQMPSNELLKNIDFSTIFESWPMGVTRIGLVNKDIIHEREKFSISVPRAQRSTRHAVNSDVAWYSLNPH